MWIWWDSVNSEHMWALWYLVLSKNHCRYFRLAVEPSIIELDGMMNQEQSCSKIGGRKNGLKTKCPAHLWGYDSYCFTSYITNVYIFEDCPSKGNFRAHQNMFPGLTAEHNCKRTGVVTWWSWPLVPEACLFGDPKTIECQGPNIYIYIKWWHSGDNPIVSRITHSLLSLQC